MPARSLVRVSKKGSHLHIYNKGVDGRVIFGDDSDYEMFISFLDEYLSEQLSPHTKKRSFTVKGKTFQGTPHLPKNYFGQVELLGYALLPTHFHLILHQSEDGSVQKFIRSLLTRYSIYFNKKFKRSGSLFAGPYKSASVELEEILPLLSYIHNESDQSKYTSRLEYLHKRKTSWVNLATVESKENGGTKAYSQFVAKHDGTEEVLPESLTLEKATSTEVLERNTPEVLLSSDPKPSSNNHTIYRTKRYPEYLTIVVLFFFLVYMGIRNIEANNEITQLHQLQQTQREETVAAVPTQTETPLSQETAEVVLGASESATPIATESASPVPAATESEIESPSPTPLPVKSIIVKADDRSKTVNLRKEPSLYSEKVGDVYVGNTYDVISIQKKWYEIKLEEGIVGFISPKYVSIKEKN